MKKLVFLVLTVILAKISLSQSISYRSNGVVTVSDMRLQAEKNFFVPRYNDTTEANLNKGIDSCGALIFSRDVNAYYYRACNPKKWTLIAGATGGNPWTLAGNSDAVAGNNFLGTTNNVPLEFRIKNVKSGLIDSATRNTTIGFAGQRRTTTATNNASFGWRALDSVTTGSFNTAIGIAAMKDNVTGTSNTAVGYAALNQTKRAFGDVAIGFGALARDSFGFGNVAVGYDVANSGAFPRVGIDTMQYNTMIGYRAGYNQKGGRDNVFVGREAGRSDTTGVGNIFIGKNAGRNQIGSNKLMISNSDTSFPLIKGDFSNYTLGVNGNLGIKTETPDSALTVNGGVRLSSLYPSNSASDSMLVIKSNGALGYRSISGGGGTTPTLQQVLNAGSTLTNNDTITAANRLRIVSNGTGTSRASFFNIDTNQINLNVVSSTGLISKLNVVNGVTMSQEQTSVSTGNLSATTTNAKVEFINTSSIPFLRNYIQVDANGLSFLRGTISQVGYTFPLGQGTTGQVLKLTSPSQIAWANDSSGGSSIDTTSLSNRINQAFTSATKISDTSFFMSSPTGTNDTITLNGAPVYVESPIMARVSNDSNIIYFNADTANAWRNNGSTGAANDTAKVVIAKVHNATGTTLQRGEVVYLSGANGDVASVKRANNKQDSTSSKTFGIVRRNIAAGDTGYITTQGQIEKLNLGAYSPGDILWLDSIDGQFTKVVPQAPYHAVFLGVVERANNGNGLMYVKPQNGYELSELHDCQINNKVNNQILVYSDTQKVWKNRNVYSVVDTTSLSSRINTKLNITDTTVFQRKQIAANSIQGNNTSAAANATNIFYKDTSGTYTGTPVWSTSAPTGTTNHSYRWTRIGNKVELNISLVYGTVSANNVSVLIPMPSDAPTPVKPAGMTAASNFLYPAYANAGNTLTANSIQNQRGGIRSNAANNGFEIFITFLTLPFIYFQTTITYYTN